MNTKWNCTTTSVCVSVFLWIRCFEISIPASGYFRLLLLVAPRSVVCSCRVRGALCELVLGVVVPVLLLLFTSAAARAGGALSRLFTWALFLAALVLLLLLRPGAGGTSGSSP